MSKIVYEHFRFVNWVNPKERDGYATVAVMIDDENKMLQYAIAFCSPQDRFCKRTGRELAAERLTWSGPVRTLTNFNVDTRDMSFYDICCAMLYLDMSFGNTPSWMKRYELED